jgi:hypothetical protein
VTAAVAPPTRARNALAALALAGAAALYGALALPLSIWLGNRPEFDSGWTQLVAPFLAPAAIAAAAFVLLVAALPVRAARRVLVLAATFVLLAWVQGMLLVWNYGLLDGARIDWSAHRWRGFVDGGLWIAAFLAADYFRDRIGRVLVRAAIMLCVLQAAMTGVSVLREGGAPRPVTRAAEAQATLAGFSPRNNVLHLVVDGFQTDTFSELLAEPGGSRLQQSLQGFTFYRDHLGAYPYTHLAVPALLGGHLYENDEPLQAYLGRSLGADSILGRAAAAGYDVEIASPGAGLGPIYAQARSARVLPIPTQLHADAWRTTRDESLKLADLALFRVVPHFAKPLVYNDQHWFLQFSFGNRNAPGKISFEHGAFLRRLAAGMATQRARPTYKVLHVMLSHRPFVTRPDCSFAGRVVGIDPDAVRVQAGCGLRNVVAVLDAMRRHGIYDAATIVITGDHGAFVTPPAFYEEAARAEAAAKDIAPIAFMQSRPLLLVKPPGATGPLLTSDAPTWLTDVPATIADAAGIPGEFPGVPARKLPVDAPRERRFFQYDYQRSEWGADRVEPMQELIVTGRGDDVRAWRVGRTLRPSGR